MQTIETLRQALIDPLLSEGERVLWSAAPTKQAFRHVGCASWVGVMALASLGVTFSAFAVWASDKIRAPAPVAGILFAISLAAVAFGAILGVAATHIRATRGQLIYAITNHRVLIGRGGPGDFRVQSFAPSQLRRAILAPRGRTVLLMPFSCLQGGAVSSALGSRVFDFPPGLFGVEDPSAVLDLIRRVATARQSGTGQKETLKSAAAPAALDAAIPPDVNARLNPEERVLWFGDADAQGFRKYVGHTRGGAITAFAIGVVIAACGAAIWASAGGAPVALSCFALALGLAGTGIGLWVRMRRHAQRFEGTKYALTSERLIALRGSGHAAEIYTFDWLRLDEVTVHWRPDGLGEILFRNVASRLGATEPWDMYGLDMTTPRDIAWLRWPPSGLIGISGAPAVQRLIRDQMRSYAHQHSPPATGSPDFSTFDGAGDLA